MRAALAGPTVLAAAALLIACSPASHSIQLTGTAPPAPTATLSLPSYLDPSSSWIEIDLTRQVLALHEAGRVAAEYPVSTGVTTDPKYATPPDLYQVQAKDKGPIESAPGVFVSNIVLFDLGRGNGIHSLPMDAQGTVLDATVGTPATAGCVRVAEAADVYEFAQIGMRVWIH